MPRTARNPSNFIDAEHTLYAGWVIGTLYRTGLPVKPVKDDAGNYTDKLEVALESGESIVLAIPYPPDGWDLLNRLPTLLGVVVPPAAPA